MVGIITSSRRKCATLRLPDISFFVKLRHFDLPTVMTMNTKDITTIERSISDNTKFDENQ